MGGHEHAGVQDLDQAALAYDFYWFTCERRPHPIAEPGQADLAPLIHPPAHTRRADRRDPNRLVVIGGLVEIGRILAGAGQTEPLDWGDVTDALMRAERVVLDHPGVERCLGLGERGEAVVVGCEELGSQGAMEPLDLAGRGRRVRGGQQVPDPVFVADPVEQHGARSEPEAGGEYFAVVRQDLIGHPVGAHGEAQRVAHRAGRGPGDEPRAHAEPRVVIDPRHHRHLGAIGEVEPADHIHLPQLHRPGSLPPLVVLATPPALGRLDQAVAHQRPIHRRQRRQRIDPLLGQMEQDRALTPRRVRPAQLDNPRLDHRSHLMRARLRLGAPIGQPSQPVVRVTANPLVHGLADHPVPQGHIRHRRPVEDLHHRLVALLHQTQLHEHDGLLRVRGRGSAHSEEGDNGQPVDPPEHACVRQVPEPVSPRYRSRVRGLSGRYRSHGVNHEPNSHTGARMGRRAAGPRQPPTRRL